MTVGYDLHEKGVDMREGRLHTQTLPVKDFGPLN